MTLAGPTVENDVKTPFVTARGLKFPLRPDILDTAIQRQLRRETYELEELRILPKILEPASRVLELGGGIGFLSSLMRGQMGCEKVVCVEANPALVDYIAQVHELNALDGIERLCGVAIPDRASPPQSRTFYVTRPFNASSLVKPWDTSKIVDEIDVPELPLSDIIARHGITKIICDIEGGEAGIFEKVAFGAVTDIVLELHRHRIGGKGINRLFQAMIDHGFYYEQKYSMGKVVHFKKVA